MTKVINILSLLFVFAISGYSQSSQQYCKITYPEFTPLNASFDISLVTSKIYKNADFFEVYLVPGSGIEIKSAEFKSGTIRSKLKISETEYDDISGRVYKMTVDLQDSTLNQGEFFQVITTFKNENTTDSKIQIAGVYRNNNEVLGYCRNADDDLYQQPFEPYFTEINLDFYKPQKYAGRSLQLNTNSFFKINIPSFESGKVIIDFWLKLNSAELDVLFLSDERLNNKIFGLKYNQFCMMHMTFPESHLEFSEPKYLSKRLWNHISIIFEKENKTVSLFCNDDLLGSGKLAGSSSMDNLNLLFNNETDNKNFLIENLRMVETDEVLQSGNKSNQITSPSANNPKKLLDLKFDSSEEFTALLQKKIIEFGGIQLVKSDAPIFTPAPELNIAIFRNSYELSWHAGEQKTASDYVLEKSTSSNQFEELVKLQALDDNEKVYSYTDAINESAGIVYYRVKQINKDGSVIYSGNVKVGQGKLNDPVIVEQNYPNPFNPKTSIVLDLIESTEVEIVVYNLEGREIITLHEGVLEKGQHKFNFDGSELPSGIYLYKVQTPSFTQTRKMILAK